jgi:hypothetical protein
MAREADPRMTPRLVMGLLIMSAGMVLVLDQLGLVDASHILRLWPLALVFLGLVKVVSPAREGAPFAGVLWMGIGLALLLHTFGVVNIWRLWPFVFVLVGGRIAFRALWYDPRHQAAVSAGAGLESRVSVTEPGPTLNVVAFMGGVERTVRGEFRGGSLTAFMGGCEINLREASLAGSEAVLDATAFWGGIELKVPDDWYVESRGVAFLGGFVDKTRGSAESGKRLIVTGLAVMGGVEIRN